MEAKFQSYMANCKLDDIGFDSVSYWSESNFEWEQDDSEKRAGLPSNWELGKYTQSRTATRAYRPPPKYEVAIDLGQRRMGKQSGSSSSSSEAKTESSSGSSEHRGRSGLDREN